VICNEENTGGRARATRDEERVLPGITWPCLSTSVQSRD